MGVFYHGEDAEWMGDVVGLAGRVGMGPVGGIVVRGSGSMASNLLVDVLPVLVLACVELLGFGFLPFTLVQGLSDFLAWRSFSRAVPYFSSLEGQRRASAGWLCSLSLSPKQLRHLMSWGHWPSLVVSIESPISAKRRHLGQSLGLEKGWSFSSWSPLHILHLFSSLHRWVR